MLLIYFAAQGDQKYVNVIIIKSFLGCQS